MWLLWIALGFAAGLVGGPLALIGAACCMASGRDPAERMRDRAGDEHAPNPYQNGWL